MEKHTFKIIIEIYGGTLGYKYCDVYQTIETKNIILLYKELVKLNNKIQKEHYERKRLYFIIDIDANDRIEITEEDLQL